MYVRKQNIVAEIVTHSRHGFDFIPGNHRTVVAFSLFNPFGIITFSTSQVKQRQFELN